VARLAVGGLGAIVLFYSFYGLHASASCSPPPACRDPRRAGFQLATQGCSACSAEATWARRSARRPPRRVADPDGRGGGVHLPADLGGPARGGDRPFALCFAWIWSRPGRALVRALAWVILALLPRNPMTRWLNSGDVFLALMHSSGGGPAPWANS